MIYLPNTFSYYSLRVDLGSLRREGTTKELPYIVMVFPIYRWNIEKKSDNLFVCCYIHEAVLFFFFFYSNAEILLWKQNRIEYENYEFIGIVHVHAFPLHSFFCFFGFWFTSNKTVPSEQSIRFEQADPFASAYLWWVYRLLSRTCLANRSLLMWTDHYRPPDTEHLKRSRFMIFKTWIEHMPSRYIKNKKEK